MKNSGDNTKTTVALQHRLLLWLLIGALALGQLQRIQISQSVAAYVHEIVLFAIVCSGLLEKQTSRSFFTNFSAIFKNSPMFFLFASWVVTITTASAIAHSDIVPVLYLSRLALIGTSAYVLHQFFKPNLRYLQTALIALGALWGMLGLLQFVLLPDTRFLFVLGWDEHYYRLVGTLFDPAFMGMSMVLASIAAMAYLPKKNLLTKTVLLSLFATVCALTYSRASYGALVIAYAGVWLIQKKPAVLPLVVSVVIAYFALWIAPKPGGEGVLLTRTASVTARTTQVEQLLSDVPITRLIFGEGLFAERTVESRVSDTSMIEIPNHARVPDNILVLLIRGTGLVGIILLLAALFVHLPQIIRNRPYLLVALTSTFLHSQFNNTLLQPFILLYLLMGFFGDFTTKVTNEK